MNQDMIDKYIAGSLSESDAQAFEEHCLANPEFARQVEYEQRLKVGLAQVASGSTAEFVRSETPLRWSLAAAAGVLIALFAVFYAWTGGMHAPTPTIMAAVVDGSPAGDTSMRLALVRGSDSIPELPGGLVRVQIVGTVRGRQFLQRGARSTRAEPERHHRHAQRSAPELTHEPGRADRQQTTSVGLLFPAGAQTGLGRGSAGLRIPETLIRGD
jgi:hypothetical protein